MKLLFRSFILDDCGIALALCGITFGSRGIAFLAQLFALLGRSVGGLPKRDRDSVEVCACFFRLPALATRRFELLHHATRAARGIAQRLLFRFYQRLIRAAL